MRVAGSDLVAELRRCGADAGLDAVGIAPADVFEDTRAELERRRAGGLHGGMQFTYRNPNRSTDPAASLPGAKALVVGALSYARPRPGPDSGAPQGEIARYAWRDHYATLRVALGAVAACLTDAGWKAVVVADDNALVDREAAYRAGLGWYGKNANVLLPKRGSWFVLGAVITDAPLPADDRLADGCGPCTHCLGACPTGALIAPGVLDARRCLAWLVQAAGVFPREYRVALGARLYGCDDCQEACPPNIAVDRRMGDGAHAPDVGDEAWVPVLDLLAADDDELLRRHGRWYIADRDPRHLRRNALVVLGNVGCGDDPAVEDALRVWLAAPDPLLRAHAVWAAARLDRRDLLDELVAGEVDALVGAELAALPSPR